jgi:hypothetical protein
MNGDSSNDYNKRHCHLFDTRSLFGHNMSVRYLRLHRTRHDSRPEADVQW